MWCRGELFKRREWLGENVQGWETAVGVDWHEE